MRVLITGCAGQDGYYLSRMLFDEHDVYGVDRRGTCEYGTAVKGDVTDSVAMANIVSEIKPDWVFNLAAQSFVGASWKSPRLYMDTNAGGVLNVLEAVRQYAPNARVVQASTSEMYGTLSGPANEETPFKPASPYGASKVAAHHLCQVYRESYGMHISCAISFNHESPRRPAHFVTRKVTQAAARGEVARLGNINSSRDWGYAEDFMRAYVKMVEMPYPDDYVIGTGVTHSVRALCLNAFGEDWEDYVVHDEAEDRPNDVEYLIADPSKARKQLGWEATTTFEELVKMMVDADRELVHV